MQTPALFRWTSLRAPLLIAAAALSIRLLYLWQDSASPFFDVRNIDAVEYDQMAHGFWTGAWPGHEPLARPPLYPLFLALLYGLIGDAPVAIKVCQALLGAASCALVFVIARRLFEDRVIAWLAAGICSAYGTLFFFDAQLLPASLEAFLQLSVILALVAASERPGSARAWLPAGVLLALSTLNRGGSLVLLPALLVWIALLQRPGRFSGPPSPAQRPSSARAPLRFWAPAAALCVPTLLALSLTAAHNAACDATRTTRATPAARPARNAGHSASTIDNLLSRRFCLIAANSGINVRLGNDPALRLVNDTNHPDHFLVYDGLLRDARRAAPQSVALQDRYLTSDALRRIVAAPVDYGALLARKTLQLVGGVEIARNANLYAHRQYSALLALMVWKHGLAFPTGLILPLAGVGLLAVGGNWRRWFPLLAVAAAQGLVILAFFVTDRYRVPLLPIAAILAAAGARHLQQSWSKPWGPRGFPRSVATLVGGLVVCNLGVAPYYDRHGAYELTYLAQDREQKGDLDSAIAFHREAVHLQPDSAVARHGLGTILRRRAESIGDAGLARAAIDQFQEAARLHPDFDAAFAGLGLTYLSLGEFSEAETAMRRAVALAPDVAVWRLDLGAILSKQGRYDEAVDAHRAALAIDPEFAPAYASIGAIREYQGRLDDAIDAYRAAVRYGADDADNASMRERLDRALRRRTAH